ncbi:metallophosphoesterase family protein [Pseudonocardia bannensis]|uniref:metallophosphoesterase family protein n=1 Tax=Pseudonocardia bannensis TaxID=630973 RepID=UPI0028AE014C|nr:metallophosphoesterase [Pseudonocardia bannensis]
MPSASPSVSPLGPPSRSSPRLLAVSDLHVRYPENRAIAEDLRPASDGDWLVVAGDVGERVDTVVSTLERLRSRFARVIWVPGNHELWTRSKDPVQLRGEHRYRYLVSECRRIDVLTPEDPFPIWTGDGGPVVIAPLFLLYDYSFWPEGTSSPEEAMAAARRAGIVCTDEHLLHPDPYPSREAWCDARVAETEKRLAALDPSLPTVLVNHWPLTRFPTRVLRYPEFALWCGTERTADWHVRFRAVSVVYGHLHIPRVTWEDGVRFVEASLGYPRERRSRDARGITVDPLPRQVLPVPQG